ncbi:MAG: YHS domain-containing protein [Pseudomonadota bacterium]|nr:MAG: YHS domain protein [Pseudomonadota bacterium]
MHVDPICGKQLPDSEGAPSVEYRRRRYYFCSPTCRAAFLKRTERARIRELARVGALLSDGKVRWGLA